MDDMINRHSSFAEENIEPNARPASNAIEEWGREISDRADNVHRGVDEDISEEEREKRIKEMEEVIKKDIE